MSDVLFLTRRNLLTLLSKLDRKKNGEETFCTIVKPADGYGSITITAVEDEAYYVDRAPGVVHPADEPAKEV